RAPRPAHRGVRRVPTEPGTAPPGGGAAHVVRRAAGRRRRGRGGAAGRELPGEVRGEGPDAPAEAHVLPPRRPKVHAPRRLGRASERP
ncbi:hypothetical protein THAOC_26661, partial [Thalassiosira oceanica]